MIATTAIDDTGIDWKEQYIAWADYRDKHVLELLRAEGFCLACLPLVGPPPDAPLDFTIFVSKRDGITNLAVAAPCWSLEKVQVMYERLASTWSMSSRVTSATNSSGRWRTPCVAVRMSRLMIET